MSGGDSYVEALMNVKTSANLSQQLKQGGPDDGASDRRHTTGEIEMNRAHLQTATEEAQHQLERVPREIRRLMNRSG